MVTDTTTRTHNDTITAIKEIQSDSFAGDTLGPALIQIIRAAVDMGDLSLAEILAIADNHLAD